MESIHIKTPFPEKATPLIKDAIELEKKLARDSLAITRERITVLARDLGVDIELVLSGAVPRTEKNELALLELEGELEMRRSLEEALRSLESLEVCG